MTAAALIQPTGVARRTEPSAALIPRPGQRLYGPWTKGSDIRARFDAARAQAPIIEPLYPSRSAP